MPESPTMSSLEEVSPIASSRQPVPSPLRSSSSPELLNPRFARRLQTITTCCSYLVAAAGGVGLLGWALQNDSLKSILPGHITLKANAALGLLASGIALWLLRRPATGLARYAAAVLSALTLLIGAASLAEYLLGVDLHIDQVLFHEPAGALGTAFPGRMGAATAVLFVLIGSALWLLDSSVGRKYRVADVLAACCGIVALVAVLGYMYGVAALYGGNLYTPISVPAAMALLAAAIGVLCARPDRGIVRLLASNGVGGLMLRRLVPLMLLVTPVLGWLLFEGEQHHIYRAGVDSVLFALTMMIALTAVVVWNAHSLDNIDTARHDVERVLRRSRDQWELTFNCMSEGLSYHDVDYTIVGANESFYRMLPGQKLAGRKCYEVVHHTDCPPDYCPMRRTLQTGRTESEEFFENRLGRYFNVRTDPVLDTAGRVVRVVHVVQDITEKKEAEAAVRRLAAIVESSDDAIIGKDLDGKILSWNRGAERIYGYPASQAIGRPVTVLCVPGQEPDVEEVLRHIRSGERVESHEAQRVRKDGAIIDVSLTLSPILDPAGRIVGASTIARDITERKRTEKERAELLEREQRARMELDRLNAELEERVQMRTAELEVSNRELEAFSYSVSHDLRAPLRSIDGFSQILLEEYHEALDDEGQDFLRRVRAASQHMGQLIDALLQLSRVTRFEMRREKIDLTALARDIAETLRRTAPERKVEFRIADGLTMSGDPRLMQVALQNLLGNAFKFTSRCDCALIEFGRTVKEGSPVFFVRDNGAGFEMAYANKLFGAFQRLHPVTEFEGSGIGLATVQRILRRHGGRIWAEGKPGEGATFYFTA